jgi:hypothetical protein
MVTGALERRQEATLRSRSRCQGPIRARIPRKTRTHEQPAPILPAPPAPPAPARPKPRRHAAATPAPRPAAPPHQILSAARPPPANRVLCGTPNIVPVRRQAAMMRTGPGERRGPRAGGPRASAPRLARSARSPGPGGPVRQRPGLDPVRSSPFHDLQPGSLVTVIGPCAWSHPAESSPAIAARGGSADALATRTRWPPSAGAAVLTNQMLLTLSGRHWQAAATCRLADRRLRLRSPRTTP